MIIFCELRLAYCQQQLLQCFVWVSREFCVSEAKNVHRQGSLAVLQYAQKTTEHSCELIILQVSRRVSDVKLAKIVRLYSLSELNTINWLHNGWELKRMLICIGIQTNVCMKETSVKNAFRNLRKLYILFNQNQWIDVWTYVKCITQLAV